MASQASKFHGRKQVDVDKDEDELKKARAGYAWESSKVRSWDQIEEDPETGRLKSYVREEQIARKRSRDDGLSGVVRGIVRYCVIVIDMSESVKANDLKPSRADLICGSVQAFVKEFFDQNPISQLSVVVTRDSEAEKVSSFSSNERTHTDAVRQVLRRGSRGPASLQNALNVAKKNLVAVPPYGMKEIVVCYGSLSTCDPGDIHSTIDSLAAKKIMCSAIGLGAELHILRVLTKKTKGKYVIAMNEEHFRDSLSTHVIPPPVIKRQVKNHLIRMGFPMLEREREPVTFVNIPDMKGRLGYHCPRCSAWLSEVPCECTLCGITLVSSPHLARSYHHLFPVPKFISLDTSELAVALLSAEGKDLPHQATNLNISDMLRCTGCARLLGRDTSLRLQCPKCVKVFCIDCDTFVHDSLHYCPGCGITNSKGSEDHKSAL